VTICFDLNEALPMREHATSVIQNLASRVVVNVLGDCVAIVAKKQIFSEMFRSFLSREQSATKDCGLPVGILVWLTRQGTAVSL
jgi:hypothetical protein